LRLHPAIPYTLPFLLFLGLLVAQQAVTVPVWLRFAVPIAAILAVSIDPLRGRPSKPVASVILGIGVFILWIAPDLIWPAWRHLPIFDNSLTGHLAVTTPPAYRTDAVFLALRIAISVIAVPILEELFWRGWLMRWLISPQRFTKIPLGTYEPAAFWITAILFASEHGPFWDVGLLAGIAYNWCMVRTRNLWDCIIAHAVTNGILAGYVIVAGRWEYWL
jgi:CAAX prenyl protease-like protein